MFLVVDDKTMKHWRLMKLEKFDDLILVKESSELMFLTE